MRWGRLPVWAWPPLLMWLLLLETVVCICLRPLPARFLTSPRRLTRVPSKCLPQYFVYKGDNVGSSEAALLSKLGIRPFSYGLVVVNIYENGFVLAPEVMDLTGDDLLDMFTAGDSSVAVVSLAIGYPTRCCDALFYELLQEPVG